MNVFSIFPVSLSSVRKGTNLSMDIAVLRFFRLLDSNNAHGEECEVGVYIVMQQ